MSSSFNPSAPLTSCCNCVNLRSLIRLFAVSIFGVRFDFVDLLCRLDLKNIPWLRRPYKSPRALRYSIVWWLNSIAWIFFLLTCWRAIFLASIALQIMSRVGGHPFKGRDICLLAILHHNWPKTLNSYYPTVAASSILPRLRFPKLLLCSTFSQVLYTSKVPNPSSYPSSFCKWAIVKTSNWYNLIRRFHILITVPSKRLI